METKYDDFERVQMYAKELIRAVVFENMVWGGGEQEEVLDKVIDDCQKMYGGTLIENALSMAHKTYLMRYNNWDYNAPDREKQLVALKSEIIIDILDILNRYGLKEWKFSEDFSKHTDLHTIDGSTAALCWLNTLYVAEDGKLKGRVEFEGDLNFVEDQDFFYIMPVEVLITIKQHLATEVRAYRTGLIKNWLAKVGATDGVYDLNQKFIINGEKARNIYIDTYGEVMIGITQKSQFKDDYVPLRDLTDAAFDKFNQYLDTQMKMKFEIRVSQVASRTIEVVADSYDQAVAMAKAEVERNPINNEDVDSIQFN